MTKKKKTAITHAILQMWTRKQYCKTINKLSYASFYLKPDNTFEQVQQKLITTQISRSFYINRHSYSSRICRLFMILNYTVISSWQKINGSQYTTHHWNCRQFAGFENVLCSTLAFTKSQKTSLSHPSKVTKFLWVLCKSKMWKNLFFFHFKMPSLPQKCTFNGITDAYLWPWEYAWWYECTWAKRVKV